MEYKTELNEQHQAQGLDTLSKKKTTATQIKATIPRVHSAIPDEVEAEKTQIRSIFRQALERQLAPFKTMIYTMLEAQWDYSDPPYSYLSVMGYTAEVSASSGGYSAVLKTPDGIEFPYTAPLSAGDDGLSLCYAFVHESILTHFITRHNVEGE